MLFRSYRKISTAQSPIVENNQQDNNTNKVVETTNQNKDEVNGKEQNQANTSVTNTQITKNEKDEDTKTLKKDKDEKDTKITKKDKEDEITTTSKKDNNNDVQDKLPESGKTNDIQNPALIMLLAGLGLLGLFRNKIRE